MFIKVFLVILLVAPALSVPWSAALPRCKPEDTTCVVGVANYFLKTFKDGNETLGIPRFDPYFYNETIRITPSASGSLQIDISGSNNMLEGLSSQTFEKAVGFTNDVTTSKFELYGTIPKMVLRGDYQAKAKVFFSSIEGNGTYVVEMEQIKGAIKFKPTIRKVENGKTFMRVGKLKVLLQPKVIRMNFTDIFNGNVVVGAAISNLINENMDVVWKDFAPAAFKASEQIMTDIINKAITIYPFEELYLS